MKRFRLCTSILAVVLLAACGATVAPPAPAGSSPSSAVAGSKPSAPASGLTKVRAAYSQVSGTQGVLYTAVELKFFQRYGLEVEAGQVAGTQQVPAMQAGELQFGVPGGNELIGANLGGVPLVMIAAVTNVPVVSLYGGKGINDVKDLAGKTVAVTSAGSATDAAAQIFLQHYGLDKQVKRQAAGTTEAVLAILQRGEVAGGTFAPPTTVIAQREGMRELVNGPKLGVPFVQSGVTVTRDYLKSKPDLVRAFLRGYYDAWKFSIDPANEAAVEQVISKWTKSDQEAAKVTYDFMVPAWSRPGMPQVSVEGLQTILALSDNPKAKDANVKEFFDNSLLEAIAGGR
jgi:NitT/TauT family transport system substrate-binding protein